jgi:serine/threonine-protein kinase
MKAFWAPDNEVARPWAGPLAPGEIVAGRYIICEFVAEGGGAWVYEASDPTAGDRVALKIGLPAGEDGRHRLRREADVYRTVRSAHLPELRSAGRTAGGYPFLALELLRGESLARRLSARPLALEASIDCARQLLEALHDLHCAGFIHCDIKPGNVFLQRDPEGGEQVKLIDFGISQKVRPSTVRPALHTVVGTPAFMSPEQLRGDALDIRVDLYAVGVVLYAMVTGRLPFEETRPEKMGRAVTAAPIIPPRVLRPSCPIELERLIMRATCRNARYRFSSARAMMDELDWVISRYNYAKGADAWRRSSSILPAARAFQEMQTRPSRRRGG